MSIRSLTSGSSPDLPASMTATVKFEYSASRAATARPARPPLRMPTERKQGQRWAFTETMRDGRAPGEEAGAAGKERRDGG